MSHIKNIREIEKVYITRVANDVMYGYLKACKQFEKEVEALKKEIGKYVLLEPEAQINKDDCTAESYGCSCEKFKRAVNESCANSKSWARLVLFAFFWGLLGGVVIGIVIGVAI